MLRLAIILLSSGILCIEVAGPMWSNLIIFLLRAHRRPTTFPAHYSLIWMCSVVYRTFVLNIYTTQCEKKIDGKMTKVAIVKIICPEQNLKLNDVPCKYVYWVHSLVVLRLALKCQCSLSDLPSRCIWIQGRFSSCNMSCWFDDHTAGGVSIKLLCHNPIIVDWETYRGKLQSLGRVPCVQTKYVDSDHKKNV